MLMDQLLWPGLSRPSFLVLVMPGIRAFSSWVESPNSRASPESITTAGRMDSGPAREERASRDDDGVVGYASIQPERNLNRAWRLSEDVCAMAHACGWPSSCSFMVRHGWRLALNFSPGFFSYLNLFDSIDEKLCLEVWRTLVDSCPWLGF